MSASRCVQFNVPCPSNLFPYSEVLASLVRAAVFKTVRESPQVVEQQHDMTTPAGRVAFCVALLQQGSPELAGMVDAWEGLPDALKAGILAMVNSAKS